MPTCREAVAALLDEVLEGREKISSKPLWVAVFPGCRDVLGSGLVQAARACGQLLMLFAEEVEEASQGCLIALQGCGLDSCEGYMIPCGFLCAFVGRARAVLREP